VHHLGRSLFSGKEVIDIMSHMLINEMKKSGRVLTKVPTEKRPTSASLKRLENEISSKIISNEIMRSKSFQNAGKTFCR
jgi:hypothetical protein